MCVLSVHYFIQPIKTIEKPLFDHYHPVIKSPHLPICWWTQAVASVRQIKIRLKFPLLPLPPDLDRAWLPNCSTYWAKNSTSGNSNFARTLNKTSPTPIFYWVQAVPTRYRDRSPWSQIIQQQSFIVTAFHISLHLSVQLRMSLVVEGRPWMRWCLEIVTQPSATLQVVTLTLEPSQQNVPVISLLPEI